MENTQSQDLNRFSAIDKALTLAKARKAVRDVALAHAEAFGNTSNEVKTHTPANKDKAVKIAERLERQQKIATERATRKALKLKVKEILTKGPVYMKKLARAASKLPSLTDAAQLLFNEVTVNFSREQLTAIALHLQHFNRVKATERALGQKVTQGMAVRIVGGDPKFVGMTGSVIRSQRIRCYVAIPGVKREVYLFTSDVEVVPAADVAKDETCIENEADILRAG